MASVSVKIDRRELRHLFGVGGIVGRLILAPRVRKTTRLARQFCPKDTGQLARSVYGEVKRGPRGAYGEVGATAPHAIFIIKGTGLYGPKRAFIVAKPGKVFAWRSRSTGQMIFATRTRGTKKNNFLERALVQGNRP